jgi:hypothetical protein
MSDEKNILEGVAQNATGVTLRTIPATAIMMSASAMGCGFPGARVMREVSSKYGLSLTRRGRAVKE